MIKALQERLLAAWYGDDMPWAEPSQVSKSMPSQAASSEPDADVYTPECGALLQEAQTMRLRALALQERLAALRERRSALHMPAYGDTCGQGRASATCEDEATLWLDRFNLPALHDLPSADLRGGIAQAQAIFKDSVSTGASTCDVQVNLPLQALSARKRQAFGLPPDGILRLTVHFDPAYHRAKKAPTFTIEHVSPGRSTPMIATSAVPEANHRFRVGFQLTNILNAYLWSVWKRGEVPSSLLVDMTTLARNRLLTLQCHCVVCDAEQPAHTTSLRPSPCANPTCIEQAETLAHGFDPQDILQAPAATDFMLTLTYAAARSGNTRFFQRMPGCLADTTQCEQIDSLIEVMHKLPAIETLVHSQDMIACLEQTHVRALPTLAWLTFSNAGYVEALAPHEQFEPMQTLHQFRIIGGPREREADFAAYKNKKQITFAFHGAPLENWHSIIRTGLRVGSTSTGFGFNGASYGSGVYASSNLHTSQTYARGGNAWPLSRLESHASVQCIALCEAQGPDNQGYAQAQNVSVYPENRVALRYLFAYTHTIPCLNIASMLPELLRRRADAN